MARMKREVFEPYPVEVTPTPVQVDATATAAAEKAAEAPAVVIPPGYVSREIVWPAQYWRVFDKQATRGGLTTSEYLRRLLAHMARE